MINILPLLIEEEEKKQEKNQPELFPLYLEYPQQIFINEERDEDKKIEIIQL